jgi:outer membrane lipoprotein carrier protein
VRQIAEQVWSTYQSKTTFVASFTKRVQAGSADSTVQSHGTVTFKRPARFIFRYESSGNVAVSDGHSVRVFQKARRQMFEQPLERSLHPGLLAFLTGDLRDSLRLRELEAESAQYAAGHVLEGVPHEPTPAYSKLLFYVDAHTHQVARVVLVDSRGNRARFDFVDPRFDLPVADEAFDWEPPEGTRIIHQ